MTTQVVTETLYALCVAAEPAWIPDEVHLITTSTGRDNAVGELLSPKGYFIRFKEDYGIEKQIIFDESTIHVICNTAGTVLCDLRTPEDNEAAADTISGVIRTFTHDEHCELHVSIAGGRKTMGFYAGYALSLFGRHQDSLSHVLVSEEFASNPNFYYPTPITHEIHQRDGSVSDARDAKVWLAQIPFVRLRHGLPKNLLTGGHGFSETVELARLAAEEPVLRVWPSECRYEVAGRKGVLSPLNTALILWVALKQRDTGMPLPGLRAEYPSLEYAAELMSCANSYDVSLNTRTEAALQAGMEKAFMETSFSRLNTALRNNLGNALSGSCKLASRDYAGKLGYGFPQRLTVVLEGASVRPELPEP